MVSLAVSEETVPSARRLCRRRGDCAVGEEIVDHLDVDGEWTSK